MFTKKNCRAYRVDTVDAPTHTLRCSRPSTHFVLLFWHFVYCSMKPCGVSRPHRTERSCTFFLIMFCQVTSEMSRVEVASEAAGEELFSGAAWETNAVSTSAKTKMWLRPQASAFENVKFVECVRGTKVKQSSQPLRLILYLHHCCHLTNL